MLRFRWIRFRIPWGSQMLVFTMILALFPGIGDLLFVKVAFRAPKVTSSRKGTAHRQNLYTQTPDSPHACGRLVCIACLFTLAWDRITQGAKAPLAYGYTHSLTHSLTHSFIPYIFPKYFSYIFLVCCIIYSINSRSGHDRSQTFGSISHDSDPKLSFYVIS